MKYHFFLEFELFYMKLWRSWKMNNEWCWWDFIVWKGKISCEWMFFHIKRDGYFDCQMCIFVKIDI
jgi:hypothetical protein